MSENNASYVTQDECAERRKEIYADLSNHDIRLTVIETDIKTIKSFFGIILGSLATGFTTIFVTLLLK